VTGTRLGGIICALAFLLLAANARASEEAPLSASPSPVELDAGGNGEVALANETGAGLSLSLRIVGEKGEALPGASVTPSKGAAVGPGETLSTKVAVPNPPTTSALVVVAAPAEGLPLGAVLRVPLSKSAAVKPAVTEWTLLDTHPGDDSGAKLPLTAACSNLNLTGASELGTVQAEGETLTVTGKCGDATAKSVDLSVSPSKADGRTYKGKIEVGATEVELTVQNKLCAAIAALLIFIGIVVALAIGAWRGGGRAASDLKRETYVVEQLVADGNPASVDKSFAKAAAVLNLPPNVQAWTVAAAARTKLAELRRPLRGFPSEETLKKTREALAALELELRNWPEEANLLGELQVRGPKLAELSKYYPAILDRTLRRTGPLELKTMADVKTAAKEAVTLANDWPAGAIATARELALQVPGTHARASFDTVLDHFHEAGSVGEAMAARSAFWDAYRELRDEATDEGFVAESMAAGAAAGTTAPFEPAETDDPAAMAGELAALNFAIDAWVLGMLLLVALAAGMQALWVDKSFGGGWDIIAALAWGVGSGAVGQPLSSALSDFGRSWSLTSKEA
jgi:hypothetical protein